MYSDVNCLLNTKHFIGCGNQVNLCDLSKAIDCIDLHRLITKLEIWNKGTYSSTVI